MDTLPVKVAPEERSNVITTQFFPTAAFWFPTPSTVQKRSRWRLPENQQITLVKFWNTSPCSSIVIYGKLQLKDSHFGLIKNLHSLQINTNVYDYNLCGDCEFFILPEIVINVRQWTTWGKLRQVLVEESALHKQSVSEEGDVFELVLVFVVGYAVFCTEHISFDVIHRVSFLCWLVKFSLWFWLFKTLSYIIDEEKITIKVRPRSFR